MRHSPPITLTFLALLCISSAGQPRVEKPAYAQDSKLHPSVTRAELNERKFHYLIKAVEQDIQQHEALVKKLDARISKLGKAKKTQATVAKYAKSKQLYSRLIELDRSTLEHARAGLMSQMMSAMQELKALEEKIWEASGKRPERKWLTLGEMIKYRNGGMVSKTPHPDAMPFLKSQWIPKEDFRSQANQKKRTR